jgi:hypothetical protein
VEYVFPAASDLSAARLHDLYLQAGRRGQIVGPHGTGKTTLFGVLAREAERRGEEVRRVVLHTHDRRLPTGWDRPACDARPALLLLDGAELLSRAAFWTVRARCRLRGLGLLITTHRPLGLPTLLRTQVTPELGQEVAARILAATPHLPRLVDAAEVAGALAQTRGDLRAALLALYDLYESRWAERSARLARTPRRSTRDEE